MTKDSTLDTTVAIVGAGPAGMMLAHCLARAGIDVTLLEMHADFDRDFRGDTIHASTMEVLDQLGLAENILQLPHEKMHRASIYTPQAQYQIGVFERLKTKYPYVTLMPQTHFLEFMDKTTSAYPHYRCIRSAPVNRLLRDPSDKVIGIGYRQAGADKDLHAQLVVGADGRFSRIRKLVGLRPQTQNPPMDVAWCRLSAAATLSPGGIHIHQGSLVVLLPRDDGVQVGCVFPKGDFADLKAQGIEAYQKRLAAAVPALAGAVHELDHWDKVHLLNVKSDCLPQWTVPGLALIGDAAHVMSPVGGIGINCAIADAVATTNVLVNPIREGTLSDDDLAKIQQRRLGPTQTVQRAQNFVQSQLIQLALANKEFTLPWFIRLIASTPGLRNLPARMIAFGPQPERLDETLFQA
ncbi:MAG: FAD-dependent oxidoreductase [Pseudomonadota bacterium]